MAEVFEVLNDREHVLKRPQLMIGGLSEEEIYQYVDGTYRKISVVPGLLVITREIIDNSVDEFIRSGKKFATKINIEMNQLSLTVEDNGRGIPVEKYKNEENKVEGWRPVLCWTQLRAGTSFSNHDIGPSSNGVGASVANILSTYFYGETWDGKKHCSVSCSDNMGKIDTNIEDDAEHPRGTKVTIEPDFERFGVSCYTPDHIIASRDRIVALSSVYPEITFTFNGEKIKTKKPKEYLSAFNKKYVSFESENYFFAIMPTEVDEYYQQCCIDGLLIRNGGTHETYLAREISYALRDIIKKKYKLDMSPAEIKRGFFLLLNARFFPKMKFDSQTKEKLSNPESEVKAYFGNIDFVKIAKEIVSVPEIIDPIIEAKLAKQIAADKRAVTLAQKKMTKTDVDKYKPAKSRNVKEKTCFICEGDCLDENTEIKHVDSDGDVYDVAIKNIEVGDYVITHNHRIRRVTGKCTKTKESVVISFGENRIICSPEHRLLVYDTKDDEFLYKKSSDIDTNVDKLVRSNFFDISNGFVQIDVTSVDDDQYDYEIVATNGYRILSSKSHIFFKFDFNLMSIVKVRACELSSGDYIACRIS